MYRVLITTKCRACAVALAFHTTRLGTICSYHVTEAGEGSGTGLTISAAGGYLTAHDGSPACCPEHGCILDLRLEPTKDATACAEEARAAMIASLVETVKMANAVIDALKRGPHT